MPVSGILGMSATTFNESPGFPLRWMHEGFSGYRPSTLYTRDPATPRLIKAGGETHMAGDNPASTGQR